MNRNILYFGIIVVLFFVILGFFVNNVFLSPKLSEKNKESEIIVMQDAGKNLLLDKKLGNEDLSFLEQTSNNRLKFISNTNIEELEKDLKNYQKIIEDLDNEKKINEVELLYNLRKVLPLEIHYLLPGKIKLSDYILGVNYEERLFDDSAKAGLFANKKNSLKTYEIITSSKIYNMNYLITYDAYLYSDKIYVNLKNKNSQVEYYSRNIPLTSRSITGYQIYNPSTAFNQRNLSIAVIIPHDNVTLNLSQNYPQYLTPIFNQVKKYYLENSENKTLMNFTLYPIFNDTISYASFADIISIADPLINYSTIDFIVLALNEPWDLGDGGALIFLENTTTPAYINTTEGPLAYMGASVALDFNLSSEFYLSNYSGVVYEHEIGHLLSFWNPNFNANYYFGGLPHAYRLPNSSSCYQDSFGNNICEILTNQRDILSVMGNAFGSFHQHSKSYYIGLSSPSRVQSVSSSGNYTLCDTYNVPPTNCPQELLLDNPFGANIALELRVDAGPENYYVCSPGFFDGVLVKVTDFEEGNFVNDTIYLESSYQEGSPYTPNDFGNLVLPYNYSTAQCLNINPIPQIHNYAGLSNISLLSYPIPIGKTMNTPLGIINVTNVASLSGGGKMATVRIEYSSPSCYSNPPSLVINYTPIFYSNLLTVYPQNFYDPIIKIKNNDICNTGPENFNVTIKVFVPTTGTGGGNGTAGILINGSILGISPQQEINLFEFPLPQMLNGREGTFNYTFIVSKISNASQNASFSGSINLIPYTPQIFGPYQLTGCVDNDPIPFTSQNLGANFTSYLPNNGATVNISNYSLNSYVPDICINSFRATDVVCGSDTGIPQIQNQGFIIVEDCRFVLNRADAVCHGGTCW